MRSESFQAAAALGFILAATSGAICASAQTVAKTATLIELPISAGTTLTVEAHPGATLYVYVKPHAKAKTIASCQAEEAQFPVQQQFALATSGPQTLTLQTPLVVGDQVCAALFDPSTATATYTQPLSVSAPAPVCNDVAFAAPPMQGNSLLVNAPNPSTLDVYVHTQDKLLEHTMDCLPTTLAKLPAPQQFTLSGQMPRTVTLNRTLMPGDAICLLATSAAHPGGIIAGPAIVGPAPASQTSQQSEPTKLAPPVFVEQVISGRSVVRVTGTPGAKILLYSFPATPLPKELSTCASNLIHGKMLATTATDSNEKPALWTTLTDNEPQPIALRGVLQPNTLLCAEEISPDGSQSAYSSYLSVVDSEDYGRVVVDLIAGAIIDNQQNNGGGSSGSTAAEYVSLGLSFNWTRAGGGLRPVCKQSKKNYVWWAPGFDTFLSSSLGSLPVSAPVSTATANSTSSTSVLLNAMNAPQSVDFTTGAALTWRSTRFFHNSNFFLLGPVAKGGFETVLTPSTSTTFSSTSGTPVLQTTTYSPLYSFHEAGMRIAWADFERRTDEAPRPYTEFDITLGAYSNLPSYICNSKKPYGPVLTTPPTNTGCYVTTPGTPNSTYQSDASRTLIPRIRAEGYARLPNYPFVIGIDANLAQYALGTHHNLVDSPSKPGNDVRLYFGLTIDPTTALKKLGMAPQ